MAEVDTPVDDDKVDDPAPDDTAKTDEGDKTDHSDRPNWESQARKHERNAKQARKEAEELKAKLAERDNADKTEQEKAIDAAREEGRTAALTEAQKERRHDRLEVAVARQAAKTFADLDDALLHVERGIDKGDIDPEDIFDADGKVQPEALKTALTDLLERKPHLAIDDARIKGDSDAGKGSGKSLDSMSVEDHLKAEQARRSAK